MKIISWNLLRLTGAGLADVARLIDRHRPDLLLLQEATAELADLPALVGGHFFREPMAGRIYGLAVWSPHALRPPRVLDLPVSQVPGHVPPRVAQIVELRGVTVANVHLSHGQLLNRWQLLHIANALHGPAAIIGDYNAVGPIKLTGFKDIGPRRRTHSANGIRAFRLDRCMGRGLRCLTSDVLARGPSDHHPIKLHLEALREGEWPARAAAVRRQRRIQAAGLEHWMRLWAPTPGDIRLGRGLFGGMDLTLMAGRRRRSRTLQNAVHRDPAAPSYKNRTVSDA